MDGGGRQVTPNLQQELSPFTLFAASLEQGEKDIRMKANVLKTHLFFSSMNYLFRFGLVLLIFILYISDFSQYFLTYLRE